MNDDRFLDRVVWMTVAFGIMGTWMLLGLGRPWHAGSFAVGAVVSLGMLLSSAVLVRNGLALGMPRRRWMAVPVAVGKYAVAALVVWRFVEWRHAVAGAFVIGVALTQIVLVLKAIGRTIAPDRKPFRWDQAVRNLTRMR